MVVKLHDMREIIMSGLQNAHWENLIEVDIDDISNKEFFVTYSELQDIENNPICESKYKITIQLYEE
ncbi:hypothetical protein P4J10_23165 [Bacillus cereus]|uniref:hypothetical protein n=1 Tax=Bacillus thuringiensis TaxID=1428 RepID=UPI000B42D0D6|nr:hypothetical protein [Bacillus thuringiensis]MEB9469496.1 hypothetical protein [Bacillus cereus]OUA18972.1 hypothetical protein BK776_28040 [Bacillus thuringiensis serovar aizawai]